jgi:hypothetical protein
MFYFAIHAGSQVAPLLSRVIVSGDPVPAELKHVAKVLLLYAVTITSHCDTSSRLAAPREYLQVRPAPFFS